MLAVKELCPNLMNDRLLSGMDQRIKLHEGKLINAMPIYRWLLSDLSLIDLSQDCIEVGIDRGINKAGSSKFTG